MPPAARDAGANTTATEKIRFPFIPAPRNSGLSHRLRACKPQSTSPIDSTTRHPATRRHFLYPPFTNQPRKDTSKRNVTGHTAFAHASVGSRPAGHLTHPVLRFWPAAGWAGRETEPPRRQCQRQASRLPAASRIYHPPISSALTVCPGWVTCDVAKSRYRPPSDVPNAAGIGSTSCVRRSLSRVRGWRLYLRRGHR